MFRGFGLLAEVPLSADVRLPAIFSDHMVLQRDLENPVWGLGRCGRSSHCDHRGPNPPNPSGLRRPMAAETRLHESRRSLHTEGQGGQCDRVSGCARRRSLGVFRPIEHGDGRGRSKDADVESARRIVRRFAYYGPKVGTQEPPKISKAMASLLAGNGRRFLGGRLLLWSAAFPKSGCADRFDQ